MPTDRNMIKAQIDVYANVLFEAVRPKGDYLPIEAQLGRVLYVMRRYMTLKDALNDRLKPAEYRRGIIHDVFGNMDERVVAVLEVMAENFFLGHLAQVRDAYSRRVEEETGMVIVYVTTVVPIDDELRTMIKKKCSAEFGGREIALQEFIDKSLLGGIILSAHGKSIDASIRSQLENARFVLSSTPSGGES